MIIQKKIAFLFACSFTLPLLAVDQVVTSTADAGANTFRSAVAAVGAGDTITFSIAPSNTITLTSNLLMPTACIIDGTNGGDGVVIVPVGGQAIQLVGATAYTLTGTSGELNFDISVLGAPSSSLVKNGAGTLILGGSGTYGGGVSLDAGQITLGNNTGLGTADATIEAGSILALNDTVNVANGIFLEGQATVDVSSGTGTISGDLKFSGAAPDSLVKTGAGTLVLSGTNTYRNGTTLSAGQITLSNNQALGTGLADELTMADATVLALSSGVSAANDVELAALGSGVFDVSSGTGTLSGVISGVTSSIEKTGAGTLILSGANTYGNGTTISEGTLEVTGSLATTGDVTLSGSGVFDMSTVVADRIIGDLTASSASSIELGGNKLTFGTASDTEIAGTISGSGALTKQGSGTVTLSGTNTYTGITTIGIGQLTLASDSGLGTGALGIVNGTTFALAPGVSASNDFSVIPGGAGTITVPSGTATLSGDFSGVPISVTKTGAGTLVLSGNNNSLTTGITLSAGQITVGSNTGLGGGDLSMGNGTTLSLASGITATNNITLGPATTIALEVPAGIGTLSGVISGSPMSVTKTGPGTLELGGANTYTNGTTVSQGALKVTGSLSSTGDITLLGSGIFDISAIAANPTIGALSTSSSSTINLGNKLLTFGTASNTELAGTIIGAGGTLLKQGSGTVTLSGTNTYTGISIGTGQITLESDAGLGTGGLSFLSNTTLEIASGISAANAISVTPGGSATINIPTGTATLSGVISDAAGSTIIKSGSGTLVLSGTSAFTETVTLSQGTLEVDGVLPAQITAETGTTLKGTGSVGGLLTVESGAALTPGNSIGTITLESLALDAGSTTNIEFDDSSTSLITVTNTADIAGTLNLVQIEGVYSQSFTYEILSAGTLNGTFDAITGGLPGFTFSLDYMDNSVFIVFGTQEIDTDGLSGNQLAFANYLNAYAPRSEEYLALAELSGEALKVGLNRASPARNAFASFVTQLTAFSLSRQVDNYLGNKRFINSHNFSKETADIFSKNSRNVVAGKKGLEECCGVTSKEKYEVWATGFVDAAYQASDSQNVPFHFTSEGVVAGFTYQGSLEQRVGFALAYAASQVKDSYNMGSSEISYYAASLYADCLWDNIYLKGAFWGIFNQAENRRKIAYSNINTKASGKISTWQIDPHVELGYILGFSKLEAQPYVSLDYVVNWEGSFYETGATNLNMYQKGHTSSMFQTEVGVKFYQSIEKCSYLLGFKQAAYYINRTPFGTGSVTSAIFGSSNFVTLKSLRRAQNLGALDLTFFAEVGKKRDVTIALSYNGQFGTEYISNEAMVTLSKSF
ncbi:MAG: hypothetical protein SP4CHLAM5_02410 [Chlamydiia bacterium]|nr:hypothetical protein [Chlamydiia bacterium]MCH9618115.1 hypothetical protein [Chlamydiia bacterium]MCH9623995.1 hypothetical protein [Chlamydiia bacterium]